MIKAENLSMSFGAQDLFCGINFAVNRGEKIGLVGRNGSGKTTLFKLMTRQLSCEGGEISAPNNYKVGYVEQHILFTKSSVVEETATGLKPSQKDDIWRAEKILSGLGFSAEDMTKSPGDFSGGYQVRINLAKVLVSDPDMLLLDEPTNYLDVVSVRWLERFLFDWIGELVLITHDRTFMDKIITHTMGIHRLNIKKIPGKTNDYYEKVALEEEIHENTRLREEKKRAQTEKFIRTFRAKASLASMVQSRVKSLEKQGRLEALAAIDNLEFGFEYKQMPGKFICNIKDLEFGYTEEKIIKDLSISIASSDRIAVIGKNGKGKSTLLKLIAQEMKPNKGEINTHNAISVGYFAQTNIERLNKHNSIVDELSTVARDNSKQAAMNIAGAMMFGGENALKKISVLSGGEKSRVSLGKILLSPSNLLLLDEPTNHLDMESCDSLVKALDAFKGAFMIVTHNEMFLHALAQKLIIFDSGKVFVFDGNYQDFLDRVGWASEGGAKTGNNVKKVLSPKESRRIRGELIKKKSQELKPIEKRISDIENELSKYDDKIFELEKELIAVASGESLQSASDVSRKHHNLKSHSDKLYAEMETLMEKHSEIESNFDESLKEYGFVSKAVSAD